MSLRCLQITFRKYIHKFWLTLFVCMYVGGDFNSSTITSLAPSLVLLQVLDDTVAEFTEGYILYLQLDLSSVNPRDVSRIQILNDVILVSILDNGKCHYTETSIALYVQQYRARDIFIPDTRGTWQSPG